MILLQIITIIGGVTIVNALYGEKADYKAQCMSSSCLGSLPRFR